jgi:hypothetical protein
LLKFIKRAGKLSDYSLSNEVTANMTPKEFVHNRRTGPGKRLNHLYRQLSVCLDTVQEELIHKVEEESEKICLAIIEDDLESLLSECEDKMLGASTLPKNELDSIESRTECVVEELLRMIGVPNPKRMFTH